MKLSFLVSFGYPPDFLLPGPVFLKFSVFMNLSLTNMFRDSIISLRRTFVLNMRETYKHMSEYRRFLVHG